MGLMCVKLMYFCFQVQFQVAILSFIYCIHFYPKYLVIITMCM